MARVCIGFSEPVKTKLGAEIIKWWMGTEFSHVYLKLYSPYTDLWLIYHASHGMVHLREASNFYKENLPVAEFEMEIEPIRLRNTIKIAQQLCGQPYGYLGLVKLVLRKKFKISGDGDRSFHCSELIARLFPELTEYCKLSNDFIEPVHLYNVLKEQVK